MQLNVRVTVSIVYCDWSVKIICNNAQVNDASFQSIIHEETVAMLKSTSVRVRLVIGKPGGIMLLILIAYFMSRKVSTFLIHRCLFCIFLAVLFIKLSRKMI